MPHGIPTDARWEGGRLVVNPVNKADPFPYGGVEIGLVRELYFEPAVQSLFVRGEEYHGSIVEVATGEIEVVSGFIARGWDPKMLLQFPGGSDAGGGSMKLTAALSGEFRPGPKLLFVPENKVTGIFFLVVSGTFMPQASARAQQSFNKEFGLPAIVWGSIASDSRVMEWGKLADITF